MIAKIIELIASYSGAKPENITPDLSFQADLWLDSIDLAELVMAMEEAFHITLPDNDIKRVRTVADLSETVHQQINGRQPCQNSPAGPVETTTSAKTVTPSAGPTGGQDAQASSTNPAATKPNATSQANKTVKLTLTVDLDIDGHSPSDSNLSEWLITALNDNIPFMVVDNDEIDCAVLIDSWHYEVESIIDANHALEE